MREISQSNKNREAPAVQMGLENTFSLRAKLVWKKDQMYLKYIVFKKKEKNCSKMIVMTLINGS